MTDNKLKSLAQRIGNLMDERDGIQSDIRDIYAEAKSHGYIPKVLRKAITRKRMDQSKRDEEDAILELYEGALSDPMRKAVEMAAVGATARQIEADTGIDQATVARSVSLNKKSETRSSASQASDSTEPDVATGNEASPGERTNQQTGVVTVPPADSTGTACGPSPAPAVGNNAALQGLSCPGTPQPAPDGRAGAGTLDWDEYVGPVPPFLQREKAA